MHYIACRAHANNSKHVRRKIKFYNLVIKVKYCIAFQYGDNKALHWLQISETVEAFGRKGTTNFFLNKPKKEDPPASYLPAQRQEFCATKNPYRVLNVLQCCRTLLLNLFQLFILLPSRQVFFPFSKYIWRAATLIFPLKIENRDCLSINLLTLHQHADQMKARVSVN